MVKADLNGGEEEVMEANRCYNTEVMFHGWFQESGP